MIDANVIFTAVGVIGIIVALRIGLRKKPEPKNPDFIEIRGNHDRKRQLGRSSI